MSGTNVGKNEEMSLRNVAAELNVPVPPEFICPLTKEVMISPLMTVNGINFEREAIIEWFENGNETCPVTKKPLDLSGLIPNRALENKIEYWKFENTLPDQPVSPKRSNKPTVFGIATPDSKKKEKAFLRAVVAKKILDNME